MNMALLIKQNIFDAVCRYHYFTVLDVGLGKNNNDLMHNIYR